jgi:hypothetical protein
VASDDGFDSWSPRQHDLEISRASVLIRAAEAADIRLSAIHVARILGHEPTPAWRALLDAVKEHLPLVTSGRERFAKVVDELHGEANWENQERDVQNRLRTWFDGLPAEQRAELRVVAQGGGADELLANALVAGDGARFDLGQSFELPADVLASLTDADSARLARKSAFWSGLGVANGAAASAFLDEHFEKETLDGGADPKEIAWLTAVEPMTEPLIQELADAGQPLTLWRCSSTPDSVLDSIRQIAVKSQHKYVTTWLPHLLRDDTRPKILQRDREAIRQGYTLLGNATQKLTAEGSFRRELLRKVFDDKLARDLDFDRSVQVIRSFKPKVLTLQASGELDNSAQVRLARLNALLAGELSGEYARRRFVEDDANRTSEKAQTIIKALAVIGPASEVLQEVMHLGGLAKFIAASGDDLAGEAAELSALSGAGVSKQELVKRMRILAPAAVVAFAIASTVDTVEKHVDPHAAGAMFSSAAVLLSAVTGVLSVKYFADNYARLAAEGKLPEGIPVDPAFLARVKELSAAEVSEDEMLGTIQSALQDAGLEGLEQAELMAQIRKQASGKEFQKVLEACGSPRMRERYVAGLKEATGVNPARLGLTIGTYTAPLFGFLLGPVFLTQPIAYAIAGSYESILGAAAIYGYNSTSRMRWNRHVDGLMRDLGQPGVRRGVVSGGREIAGTA